MCAEHATFISNVSSGVLSIAARCGRKLRDSYYLILATKCTHFGGDSIRGLGGQPSYTKLQSEVKHNVKIKFYPDGANTMIVASKPIFLEKGYEDAEWKESVSKPKNMNGDVRNDSLKRSMQKVFDMSRINIFKWFITWTLDKKEVDRYDRGEVSKKLKIFLKHKVERNNAKYLVIPEYHEDGAIHMHGLLSGNFKMVNSGKKTKGGATIYNMPDWKLGWSTAIELDENVGAISRYITKYISKDFRKIFGSFYYAGGHGLNREPPIALYDINYHEVKAPEFGEYTRYKYVEVRDYADENSAEILRLLEEYYEY